jgi:hypothetical protein
MEIMKFILCVVFIVLPAIFFGLLYAWHYVWVPIFGNPFNPNNEPLRATDSFLEGIDQKTLDNVERNRRNIN